LFIYYPFEKLKYIEEIPTTILFYITYPRISNGIQNILSMD